VKRRYLPLALSLLMAVILVFVVEDFVRQVIVTPILYVSWFIALVVGSLPQWVFWVAFVVLALVIARKSMARDIAARRRTWVPPAIYLGPVVTWAALLDRAQTRPYARWRLAQTLKRLTQDILALETRSNFYRREEQWNSLKQVLPPAIEAFFEAPPPEAQPLFRLWRRSRARGRSNGLDLAPETVVKFLEDRLAPLSGE
jgi:hypothetical protein